MESHRARIVLAGFFAGSLFAATAAAQRPPAQRAASTPASARHPWVSVKEWELKFTARMSWQSENGMHTKSGDWSGTLALVRDSTGAVSGPASALARQHGFQFGYWMARPNGPHAVNFASTDYVHLGQGRRCAITAEFSSGGVTDKSVGQTNLTVHPGEGIFEINVAVEFVSVVRSTCPGVEGGERREERISFTKMEIPIPPGVMEAGGRFAVTDGQDDPWEVEYRLYPRGANRLAAVPGGPYRAERGGQVALDGSASRGEPTTYAWTFTPGRDCPPGVSAGGAPWRADGETVAFVALCSGTAELTVTDGRASDRRTVAVTVAPREWKTPFEHVAEEGRLGGQPPLMQRVRDSTGNLEWVTQFVGGRNVDAHDGREDARETLYPWAEGGTWEGRGYVLEQVDDGGPFAGAWYVREYKLDVKRKTLVNEYLVPGGKQTRLGSVYEKNKTAGHDMDAYLAAIRAHEGLADGKGVLGHSGLIRKVLAAEDPAPKIEALVGRDREALRTRVDEEVAKANGALCSKTADPLPQIWRGTLTIPRVDSSGWETGTAVVGGPGYGAAEYYGAMAACK